jgi:hypothetical protein
VLTRLARGESTARIAASLDVGTATVRTHVQNLFYKFGTHSRLELLAHARRAGLLSSATDQGRGHAGGGGVEDFASLARSVATPLAGQGGAGPSGRGRASA